MSSGRENQVAQAGRRVSLEMRFTQYAVPPVKDALIIGRMAPIGSKAISKAFDEMCPNVFKLVPVDHPVIEAVLVRVSDLRRLPETELIPRLIRHAEGIMDDTEALHVSASITVMVQEEVEM